MFGWGELGHFDTIKKSKKSVSVSAACFVKRRAYGLQW